MTDIFETLGKRDERPMNGGWAPGYYTNKCSTCGSEFIGDKRAITCADCAYAKERPILFNGEMVRAILDGRKIQTRRIMKVQPPCASYQMLRIVDSTGPRSERGKLHWAQLNENKTQVIDSDHRLFTCPFGEIGDRLWVRETWATVNTESGPALAYRADSDVIPWREFCDTTCDDGSMDYEKYPGDYCMWWSDLFDGADGHKWKPSIHMPRWASRITLEITDIRVERLLDITERNARLEGPKPHHLSNEWGGVEPHPDSTKKSPHWRWFASAINAFLSLWESIYGTGSLNANPWVWVIEFKRVGI
ncbi:hypothetical protein [Hahella ganghwensis]|uniref:hypothetical protein n=1 Tax=Hahella ganghwensis TaxID=286420 RepID=UPI0003618DFA|nr:hypothetical protein [Hahella ganghwensis]